MISSGVGWRAGAYRYVAAVAAVALATVARIFLIRVLGDRSEFLLAALAVLFAAWTGGRGPGLAALALSLLASRITSTLALATPVYTLQDAAALLLFACVSVVLIELVEAQRLASRRASYSILKAQEQADRLLREVEERRLVEAALRDGEERLRTIVNTAVDSIIVIDDHGIVQSMNTSGEALFGYREDEVVGRNVTMLMPSPFRDEHDEYLRAYLETGVKKIIGIGREVVGLRKDGREIPVELAVSEMRVGGRRCFTGLLRDLTERKRLEDQLVQAQKMESVGRLAGGVAHDFNNILTAIIGYAELARKREPADSALASDLTHVEEAGQRAASLTRQLLAFARRQIIEPRVVDLNALVRNLEKMLGRLISEDVELTISTPADELPVRVDPGQIEQVVMNLCVNARDAMPRGGKLTIETAGVELDSVYASRYPNVSAGAYAMLAVSDDGEGMDRDTLSHVFEPFFTTKEQGKGTGLGLATCHGIVRQAGGHIWVYSEPQHGSVFKIYLPRVGDPIDTSSAPVVSFPRGSETVLLVEDDRMVRDFAARGLREQGYMVLVASNGAEALRLAEDHAGAIDLLFSDVVMPQMSGSQLADRLRGARPEMKVLFASGYTDDAIVQHGVLDPGVLFIQKPYTTGTLARRIRAVLDPPG